MASKGVAWVLHPLDIIKCGWCNKKLLVPKLSADEATKKAINEQRLKAISDDTVVVKCPCDIENLHPDKKRRKDERLAKRELKLRLLLEKLENELVKNKTAINPTNISNLSTIEAELDQTQSEEINLIVDKEDNCRKFLFITIPLLIFLAVLAIIGVIAKSQEKK